MTIQIGGTKPDVTSVQGRRAACASKIVRYSRLDTEETQKQVRENNAALRAAGCAPPAEVATK